jgi:hypothetical protein
MLQMLLQFSDTSDTSDATAVFLMLLILLQFYHIVNIIMISTYIPHQRFHYHGVLVCRRRRASKEAKKMEICAASG